ncbi:MAG TPA: DUF4157 domain-containing protein [Gaiellaceae bacterium]|nr:DUF4157 domain-containing protein [Gaiellaceae bacterium]
MAEPARQVPAPPPRPPDRLPRPEQPKPKPPPQTSSGRPSDLQSAPPLEQPSPTGGPGSKLPPPVAAQITRSLGVDMNPVRVHTDTPAAETTHMLGARALTVGRHIFLGRGERPTDVGLMAHEAAHVVQQRGAPRVQLWSQSSTDRFEHEAHRASSAVVARQPFRVTERTTPRVQRFGISDLLDWFADKANNIPGYRMFTVVIGVNPINGASVARSGANILRAAIEFIPGGHLIVEALEKYGVFEKAGAWLEQQIATLGMAGSMFIDALKRFIDSLSWTDIFHPGRVWDRAKEMFLAPIRKLIEFFVGLAVGILKLIKEAILKPLAKLAEGTPAWDLLLQVLGENPITGEKVPQSADALIGGFMKMIGQEEIWNNIKKANAISRAFAWFKGALAGLLAFVRAVPGMFLDALRSLEIMDIVVLPRAFIKVGKAFLGIAGRFFSWALQQVLSLLQIIFEVVAPGAVPYIQKARGAFNEIIRNPVKFIGNLVRAGKAGFDNFRKNFLGHLRKSIIDWLTGSMAGANIYIPQAFELKEIIKFILSVLGLTWPNVRSKLVKAVGEPVVVAFETGFDIVLTLVKEGPAAAWEKIKEQLSNLKEMLMGMILDFVKGTIVEVAITKILSFLSPVGAFIQAIIGIYNTIMFFIERLKTIAQVVGSFIDSIASIAAGNIGSAAARVEQTMAGLLTLVISFLARFAGLGKVSDEVKKIIQKIRDPIDKALDKVVEWIVNLGKKIGRFFANAARGPQPANPPPDPQKQIRINAALAMIDAEDTRVAHHGEVTKEEAEGIAQRVRQAHPVLRTLTVVDAAGRWDYDYTASPGQKKTGAKKLATGDKQSDPIDFAWFKPRVSSYKRIMLAPAAAMAGLRSKKGARPPRADVAKLPGSYTVGPSGGATPDGQAIGATGVDSQTAPNFVFRAQAKVSGNAEKDRFNALIERFGYNRDDNLYGGTTDGDHVMEKQLGGHDQFDNVWPLDSSVNRTSGSSVRAEIERITTDHGISSLAGKWLKLKF